MANSRILAMTLVAALTAGLAPGLARAQTAAAPAKQAPAKESFRSWTWNKVSGNWKRMAGVVKERWGKLTHNEIREAQGRRETLNGYIQTRYGIDREAADKQIDEWLKTLK
jgi:uncharacterized protein YjbJ (UPF0337 family)